MLHHLAPLLVLVGLLAALASPLPHEDTPKGNPCASCSEELCCRDWEGTPKGCRNATSKCCYDGSVCPFCDPNADNFTCCTYFPEEERVLTCGEGFKCAPADIPGGSPTECVFNGTACDGCPVDKCCKDFRGVEKECMRNSTLDYCCYDGTVCPFCAADSLKDTCCNYNKETDIRTACTQGETCYFDSVDDKIKCRLQQNCSACFVGTQCCLVDNIPDACVDPEVQYCCLDGVHCQHSVCGEPGVTHPADAECCSGARGLFCPRGAYTAQDKYCSLSANIPTCQAHTRKDSCADCVNGLECCQASTGEFFGCYDPYVTTCCAIDGSHCPNFAPFPCSSEAQFPYNGECCRYNGTAYEICPAPGGNPEAIYCRIGGGCQTGPRGANPPEFSTRPPPYEGPTTGQQPIPPGYEGPIGSPNTYPPGTSPTGPPGPPGSTPSTTTPSTTTPNPNSPNTPGQIDSAKAATWSFAVLLVTLFISAL